MWCQSDSEWNYNDKVQPLNLNHINARGIHCCLPFSNTNASPQWSPAWLVSKNFLHKQEVDSLPGKQPEAKLKSFIHPIKMTEPEQRKLTDSGCRPWTTAQWWPNSALLREAQANWGLRPTGDYIPPSKEMRDTSQGRYVVPKVQSLAGG